MPSARHANALTLYADSVANPIVAPVPGLLPMPTKSRGLPGVALLDYDMDGDLDVFVTNGPGALINDGAADFSVAADAFSTNHAERNVQGVASGDLDGDGFVDVVSVANEVIPSASFPVVP